MSISRLAILIGQRRLKLDSKRNCGARVQPCFLRVSDVRGMMLHYNDLLRGTETCATITHRMKWFIMQGVTTVDMIDAVDSTALQQKKNKVGTKQLILFLSSEKCVLR